MSERELPPMCPPSEHSIVCYCGLPVIGHNDPTHSVIQPGCDLCWRLADEIPEGEL